jgi:hypothetical protein
MTGVLIGGFIVILVVIAITIVVTLKAYSVTYSETIDQVPVKINKAEGADKK